jgi:hypothetical protein
MHFPKRNLGEQKEKHFALKNTKIQSILAPASNVARTNT